MILHPIRAGMVHCFPGSSRCLTLSYVLPCFHSDWQRVRTRVVCKSSEFHFSVGFYIEHLRAPESGDCQL